MDPMKSSAKREPAIPSIGLSRRDLVRRAVGAALAGASTAAFPTRGYAADAVDGTRALPAEQQPAETPVRIPREIQAALGIPDGPPQQIAMLVYPQMTALDLIGPQQILASIGNVEVHLVWKERSRPVVSDSRIPIMPTKTFAECPDNLTVLLVPGGGLGTLAVMQDEEVLDFLAAKGKTAKWITSVCTGSLVLGAAGLLDGYRATSHWAMRDTVLPLLGAIPVKARVVEDRNRMTGGGVTAGIDFGLQLAARLRGEKLARAVQLGTEYDPHPPFNAGSPEGAGEDLTGLVRTTYAPVVQQMSQAAEKVRRRRTPVPAP